MRATLLFALGVACADPSAVVRPPPGAGGLFLSVPSSLVAGSVTDIAVAGAVAGQPVVLAGSVLGLGQGPCPPSLQGLCVGIRRPVVLQTVVADNAGVARFSIPLPAQLPVSEVYLQAGQAGTSPRTSLPLSRTIALPSDDSDDDGLVNADELIRGTDPVNPDTDGDGYLDGVEVVEGTDPLDDTSGLYIGGWPFNPDKNSMAQPSWTGPDIAVGRQMPRLFAIDQYGEQVDMYDFALQGRPILVHLLAGWCAPCHDAFDWLGGGSGSYASTYGSTLPNAIARGDLLYVGILAQDLAGNVPSSQDVVAYGTQTADPPPVLGPPDTRVENWANVTNWPGFILLDEDMTVLAFEDPAITTAMTLF